MKKYLTGPESPRAGTSRDNDPRRRPVQEPRDQGRQGARHRVWISWLLVVLAGLLGNFISKPPAPFPFQKLAREHDRCFFRSFSTAPGTASPPTGWAGARKPHRPVAAGRPPTTTRPRDAGFLRFLVAVADLLVNAALRDHLRVGLARHGLERAAVRFTPGGVPVPRASCQFLFLWNVFLFILNILPCYPIDGGRMLQAFIWSKGGKLRTRLSPQDQPGHGSFCLVTGLPHPRVRVAGRRLKFRHPLLSEVGLGFPLPRLPTALRRGRALQHHPRRRGRGSSATTSLAATRGLERTATREGEARLSPTPGRSGEVPRALPGSKSGRRRRADVKQRWTRSSRRSTGRA